jgi:threonine dehydratase
VWLKLEFLQHSGSFKARGAFNRILSAVENDELPSAGVIAASGGNAGLVVAFAARSLRVPAEVSVPVTAPAVKVPGRANSAPPPCSTAPRPTRRRPTAPAR